MSTPHPLVTQLRFTRAEFMRAIDGVSDEDGAKRVMPMNCIAWNVGHLAWQEQAYYLVYAQQQEPLLPEVATAYAYGAPASTPKLADTRAAWHAVTQAVDPYLDTLTSDILNAPYLKKNGMPGKRSIGNLVLRMIYHYWYHLGENMAIRQQLGHTELPEFVGDIDHLAPYTPEA